MPATILRRRQSRDRTICRSALAGRRTQEAHSIEGQRRRVRQLLATEIQFVPNSSFHSKDAEQEILGLHGPEYALQFEPGNRCRGELPRDLPAHLARLCETALLPAARERDFFRRMNYLKYRANALRTTLDPRRPHLEALETAERLLREAKAIRDHIVKANMRLVTSVVKNFVRPQHSFDEMLSDGIMTMMNAVDRFDYDRGFRFSTYAYRSVARNAYRSIMARKKENSRHIRSSGDVFDTPDERDTASIDEQTWESLRGRLEQMFDRLDRRERFIIRGRYALGGHHKVQTFQYLADKLGVSRERVRQLEQKAMAKLRMMAPEMRMDELIDPAVV